MATRAIFEDVSGPKAAHTTPLPGAAEAAKTRARRATRQLMVILFALVVVMIAVGGLTRLTDSGLSITEWRPITGVIPPLSEVEWFAEFDKYRAIPEYQLQNQGMSLEAFKVIYWWEWGHRMLGRVIGLVWAVGFLLLWLRGRLARGFALRLWSLGSLGALQGAIGWWMVASGLTGTMVDVASYRLATHLGLAFVILSLLAWSIFRLGRAETELFAARRRREGGRAGWAGLLAGVAFLQILLGALVAGIDAGRYFPEWPTMAGQFFPPDALRLQPIWRNAFEDAGLAQFNHRMLGYALFALGLIAWALGRRSPVLAVRRRFDWMMLALLSQMVVGIVTVLYAAPWHLAIVHQFLAVVLLTTILSARFVALYPPEERVARG